MGNSDVSHFRCDRRRLWGPHRFLRSRGGGPWQVAGWLVMIEAPNPRPSQGQLSAPPIPRLPGSGGSRVAWRSQALEQSPPGMSRCVEARKLPIEALWRAPSKSMIAFVRSSRISGAPATRTASIFRSPRSTLLMASVMPCLGRRSSSLSFSLAALNPDIRRRNSFVSFVMAQSRRAETGWGS